MKRSELAFSLLKIPADFLLTIAAFLVAYELRLITEPIAGIAKPIDYSVLPTKAEYLYFSTGAALALTIVFAISGMYSLKNSSRFSRETKNTIKYSFIWLMLIITYFFFTRSFPFSRLAVGYSWILTIFFIIIGRGLINSIQNIFFRKGIGKTRLLFIGNNHIALQLQETLQKNISYKIVGMTNTISELEQIIKRKKVDEIIQTKSDLTEAQDQDILQLCDTYHITYRFVPDLIEVRHTNVDINHISGIPIISLKPTPLEGWGKVTKRILDIIFSTLGLIILSPIFLATAIAIKIDSKGPILFSKLDDGSPVKRVGRHGKLFKFYKFRSMLPNTHNQRYIELAEKNTREEGPLVKIKNDPRVTKVGRFIRKYSIDELPQLWNVFLGNMSLVGPRAHLPEEVAKYKNHHRFLLTIKPGVTGLAQVSGRSDLNFEDEVKLDRSYIENWSILLDLKIIFKTIFVVLKGHDE